MPDRILLIPGPTPVPEEVSRAMSTEMFDHRGPRFKALQEHLVEGLKKVFQTVERLYILTASGTGAMEASMVNFFSPGNHIISMTNGSFGDRFAEIAEIYDLKADKISSEWGKPLDYKALEKKLAADRTDRIKAITVVHNESSTGMMNNVQAISKIRGRHPALLIVDTVSSMGAVDIPVDRWGLDVCLTASQKALMLPPGLSVISVSKRSWKAAQHAGLKSFYFSLPLAQEYFEKGQTPFTPALSQMTAMEVSLGLYFKEGRQNCYARHRRMAQALRTAIRALGLELLVEDESASMTVTAVLAPKGIDVEKLRADMRDNHGVEIAGGQGRLSGRIFRFGHLGATREQDLRAGVAALESALSRQGYPVQAGQGARFLQSTIKSPA